MTRRLRATAPRPNTRCGFTLVELLVVLAVIGILIALLLPAVQAARESSRRTDCLNRLKQVGLALQNYHDVRNVFPPGYIEGGADPTDGKAWGWGVFALPYLEKSDLYSNLDPDRFTLGEVSRDPLRQPYLRVTVPYYRCPSDPLDRFNMARLMSGQMLGNLLPSSLAAAPSHIQHPPPPPRPPKPQPPGAPPPTPLDYIPVASANYVASFGSRWPHASTVWPKEDLAGNGMFGCDTELRLSDILDGTSHTIAVGERAWGGYAGVWAGVDFWEECLRSGNQMVLGTTFYRLNTRPNLYVGTCDSEGAAGFSSMHSTGAQFVFCDGSVRLLRDSIDFQNSDQMNQLGVFQRLSVRNDGQGAVDE